MNCYSPFDFVSSRPPNFPRKSYPLPDPQIPVWARGGLQVGSFFLMHTNELVLPPVPISVEALMVSAVRRPVRFDVS